MNDVLKHNPSNQSPAFSTVQQSFLHLYSVTASLRRVIVTDRSIEAPNYSETETRTFLSRANSFLHARELVLPLVRRWRTEKSLRSGFSWYIYRDVLTELYQDHIDIAGSLRVLEVDQTNFIEDELHEL